jgi:hypothetical protein
MVKFDFKDKECSMTWSEGLETNTIILGLDGHYRYSKITLGNIDFTVCANAIWLDDESLLVTIRPIQTVAKRNLVFEFKPKDKVVMIPSSSPSGTEILNNLGGFFEQMIPNKTILNLFNKVLKVAAIVMEPKHHGKFIEK